MTRPQKPTCACPKCLGLEDVVIPLYHIMRNHDEYTYEHEQQTADLARAIAKEMKLPDETVEWVYYGGLIHDIGKIKISAALINKPSPLSKKEFDIIKTHCQHGFDMVKSSNLPEAIPEMILYHHEREDGSGYPVGLNADQYSLEAKIIAVADVVSAMCFKRPYRKAFGERSAIREIVKHRGTLFDPEVVDACVALFKSKRFQF